MLSSHVPLASACTVLSLWRLPPWHNHHSLSSHAQQLAWHLLRWVLGEEVLCTTTRDGDESSLREYSRLSTLAVFPLSAPSASESWLRRTSLLMGTTCSALCCAIAWHAQRFGRKYPWSPWTMTVGRGTLSCHNSDATSTPCRPGWTILLPGIRHCASGWRQDRQ